MVSINKDSPLRTFRITFKSSKKPNPLEAIPVTVQRYATHYNMNHPKRGYALIFNNKTFDSRRYSERTGTDVDAKNLEDTLAKLKFQVTRCNNLTAQDIKSKAREFSRMNYTDMDCVLVVILSHGLDFGKIMARDAEYKLDEITQLFQPDQCPSLAGKPKLFFIQACRGELNNSGVAVMSRSLKVIETDSAGTSESFTIPMYADYLMAFSTVPGHVSMRNITDGSWFIQSVCSNLNEYADKEDLMGLLTFICQDVAMRFESENTKLGRIKQMPCFVSTLMRKLLFVQKDLQSP